MGTSSGKSACSAGPAAAVPVPTRNVNPSNPHGVIWPLIVSNPNIAEKTIIHACVTINSRRRSSTSAKAPAKTENRQIGRFENVNTLATIAD